MKQYDDDDDDELVEDRVGYLDSLPPEEAFEGVAPIEVTEDLSFFGNDTKVVSKEAIATSPYTFSQIPVPKDLSVQKRKEPVTKLCNPEAKELITLSIPKIATLQYKVTCIDNQTDFILVAAPAGVLALELDPSVEIILSTDTSTQSYPVFLIGKLDLNKVCKDLVSNSMELTLFLKLKKNV